MNQYETVFILTPVLSDEQMKEAVGKFRDYLTSQGSEILYEENWGMRKLAYNINKKSTGYYVVLPFKANAELPKELDRRMRINENVMRHIIVSQDEE